MPRLSSQQILALRDLISKKKSLNQICSELHMGKTTAYYYLRKTNGKKTKPLILNSDDKTALGEVIGIFAGDGHYSYNSKKFDKRIKIYFNAREGDIAHYYQNSFLKISGKVPGIISYGSVKILQLCSKDFCNFLLGFVTFSKSKVRTIQLKDKSLLLNEKFRTGFLRGLIDSDGYVRKGRKEIYFGSISYNLFNDFIYCLDLLKFKYSIYCQKRNNFQDFYKVRLSGEEVDKFIEIIRPRKAVDNNAPTRN